MPGGTIPPSIEQRLQVVERDSDAVRRVIDQLARREPTLDLQRQIWIAETAKVGETYPATGNTFGIIFQDGSYPRTEGSPSATYSDRSANPLEYAKSIAGNYYAEGSKVAVFEENRQYWILDGAGTSQSTLLKRVELDADITPSSTGTASLIGGVEAFTVWNSMGTTQWKGTKATIASIPDSDGGWDVTTDWHIIQSNAATTIKAKYIGDVGPRTMVATGDSFATNFWAALDGETPTPSAPYSPTIRVIAGPVFAGQWVIAHWNEDTQEWDAADVVGIGGSNAYLAIRGRATSQINSGTSGTVDNVTPLQGGSPGTTATVWVNPGFYVPQWAYVLAHYHVDDAKWYVIGCCDPTPPTTPIPTTAGPTTTPVPTTKPPTTPTATTRTPTTAQQTTAGVTTPTPTTRTPTSDTPTTDTFTTRGPTSWPPTTPLPTTRTPTTDTPTTRTPTTDTPSTRTPTTDTPSTRTPTTGSPTGPATTPTPSTRTPTSATPSTRTPTTSQQTTAGVTTPQTSTRTPTTDTPSTRTPTTSQQTTAAVTTPQATTRTPTTDTPTTRQPTTDTPTTDTPTTETPTTRTPTTQTPTTRTPTTAQNTEVPTTRTPTTRTPTTETPTTRTPTTQTPTTRTPTTDTPTTRAPTTQTPAWLCNGCVNGKWPSSLSVSITGLVNGEFCEDCTDMGVSAIINTTTDDNYCSWRWRSEDECKDISVTIRKTTDPTPTYILTVTLHLGACPENDCPQSNTIYYEESQGSPFNCMNLNANVPVVDDESELGGCDASASTCIVTS